MIESTFYLLGIVALLTFLLDKFMEYAIDFKDLLYAIRIRREDKKKGLLH